MGTEVSFKRAKKALSVSLDVDGHIKYANPPTTPRTWRFCVGVVDDPVTVLPYGTVE